jgi:diguanylate cyclase (GGDEF)-like protein
VEESVKSHALIIEDDQDTASLFSHILEFIGFKTEIIQAGEPALEKLSHCVPDIVLLDIQLASNVSGLDILNYIKSEDRLVKSRVIVITGYPVLADNTEHKADLVLLKPISARQLSTMVLRLCPDHVYENFLHNASYDAVTGLMNYARLKDRLVHATRRAKRVSNLQFAIILMRIEEFEALKITYGQQLTNQLLLTFVGRLRGQFREIDTFSRLSEDKFGILLENINDPQNAAIVATRIRVALEPTFEVQGQVIPIQVSIDIVFENLIEQVDAFLQESA